ncbi:MAG: CARDB domain-containing protein [Candidatus Altiarchaeota archaeon]
MKRMLLMFLALILLSPLTSAKVADMTKTKAMMTPSVMQFNSDNLYKPAIYGRYVFDKRLLLCTSCSGPSLGSVDSHRKDSVTCITTVDDECVNTTHVKEYYCNGTRISHLFTGCVGGEACSGGVCMLLPDLTITRINYAPDDVGLLDVVSLRIEVANIGFDDAPAVNLTVYWTCEPITVPVAPLPAGNSTVIQLNNTLIFQKAGKFDVVAFVDSGHSVDEYNEGNNNLTQRITVELPGLSDLGEPASELGEEPMTQVSCGENDLMKIGRSKSPGGLYYRDEHGDLPRELGYPVWDGTPPKNRIPHADFTFEKDHFYGYFNFTDASSDYDGNITGRLWYFEADGFNTTLQNFSHDLSNGEHMVWLTVTDDDGESATVGRSITVGSPQPDLPRADFFVEYNRGATIDHFDNSDPVSGVNITDYRWSLPWSDDLTLEDVQVQYQSDGVFNITHTVTDEAGHTSTVVRTTQIESIWLPGQGPTNACGTTSLAYILRYLTGSDSHTHFTVDDECRASASEHSWGNEGGMFGDPTILVEYARSQGVNAEVYQNGDFSEIRRFIDRGIPVMLVLTTDGTGNVFAGHFIVVVNYCSRPTGVPGEMETVYAIYNPWGYQYEIPEDRLARYWGQMTLGDSDILLWKRLYIAVSNQSLPAGDLDDIKTELAFSTSLSMMSNGADDFADGEVVEGLVEMFGGTVTTIVSGLSDLLLGWGGHTDKVPLIGGVFGAADELVGGVVSGLNEFIDSLASDLQDIAMFWYDPLAALAAIGDLIVSVLELIADVIVAVLEFIVDVLVAIVDFLADLFEAIGRFFCWLFGMDCTRTVCVVERMVSIDECGEANQFSNKYSRISTLGYLGDVNESGRQPLHMLVMADFGTGEKNHKLTSFFNSSADSDYVRVGTIGYSKSSCTSDCVDLTTDMENYTLSWGNNLGYSSRYWEPNSSLLWLFQNEETGLHTVSTDACLNTRTFVSNSMKGYTRSKIVGYIRLTPGHDTSRLYRYYNAGKRDFFLSLDANDTSDNDYVINGFMGYVYNSNLPGTVPLYSYSAKHYAKQNITIQCETEEREYDTPIGFIHAEEQPCTLPVYKYCKRYVKEV